MKKIFSAILLIGCILLLNGCQLIKQEQKDDVTFNALLDEIFLELLGDDPMSVNFRLLNPENYGLDSLTVEAIDFSLEAETAYFEGLREIISRLEVFSNKVLSKSQQLTKNVVMDYMSRQLAFEGYYHYGTNLSSLLGYQIQLPLIMAEYRFDDANDIEHYLDYLDVTPTNFASLIAFENERTALYIGFTDVTLTRIIEQCMTFIGEGEHYLIAVFNDKIDSATFLTSTEKIDFKNRNKQLIENEFLGAYQYLIDELTLLLGTATHNGALASFPYGAEYYQVLFQEATGSNYTVLEAKDYLQSKLNSMMNTYRISPHFYDQYMTANLMGTKKLDDLMPYFMEKMAKDFPPLGVTLTYRIEMINEALQENASPAMYFISPMDANIEEVIYINPLQFSEENNYMFKTIAHEGFPGHLYQNVYMKTSDLHDVRKLISYTSYAEAWATYVENYVVGFVNPNLRPAFEFFDSINYIILGLADIGVNYEGWTFAQTKTFLKSYFSLTDDDVADIINDLIEIPTHYLQYYFSYYQLLDIKSTFQEIMGSQYSDLLFHTIFLETGSVPFHILEEEYLNYKG